MRAFKRGMDKMNKTYVLYAKCPDGMIGSDLYPKERMDEIKKCASQKAQREKYYVWVLLGRALRKLFNLDIDNLQFTKKSNGKWISPSIYFSLAHTDGLVAVAISLSSVGVDCEFIRPMKSGIENKILTERELCELESIPSCKKDLYIIDKWCRKEAIFKMKDSTALMPKTIECDAYNLTCEKVSVCDREYLLACCTSDNISEVVTEMVILD